MKNEKTNSPAVTLDTIGGGQTEIRRIFHNDEWWFAVVDVVAALTESAKPRDYWYRLKKPEKESSGIELSTVCRHLKLSSSDGKKYKTECANLEGIFRIIQSIPSKKAEPFKQWLAKVGHERIKETENPELAAERIRAVYKAQGYSDDWIEMRMQSIAIRSELTNEWKKLELITNQQNKPPRQRTQSHLLGHSAPIFDSDFAGKTPVFRTNSHNESLFIPAGFF